MIDFVNVTKRFGGQTVLDGVNFRINAGERVGIVGPNGAGKTTIFGLITGEQLSDKGDVIMARNSRLGHVRQQLNAHDVAHNLLEYVEAAATDVLAVQTEIESLEAQLQSANGESAPSPTDTTPADATLPATLPRGQSAILRRLGELQTRFEAIGGYSIRHRAERALSGLGFPVSAFHQPFASFSGGWQSRGELARILVNQPDLLLLDEPSNYLDNPTVEWLQRYLRDFRGTLLMISHDRFLLNSLTNVTLEIANGLAERYPSNYDGYAQARVLRFEQRLAAQKNQDRKREQLERFIERFRAKSTKAAQVQSRVKQLEKMDEIALPQRIVSPGRIRISPPPHCGAEVLRLEGAGITYDGQRWVLRGVDLRVMRGEKLALVGYNGLGKTTLLRMLSGHLAPSEGRRVLGHQVRIGYQSQDFAETMDPMQTVFAVVKSAGADVPDQQIRGLLGGFGFSGEAVEKSVQVLSGGEKIRLSLARLLVKPPNVLILDEPTTHLDIQARESLERALREFEGTILVVSHDIEFLRHVAEGIVAMSPPGITRYPGGYDYYHEKLLEAEAAGGTVVTGGSKTAAPTSSESAGDKIDKKALRQLRAQERQAQHEKTKDLKRAIKKAESEVERLEKEKTELAQQLSTPSETINYASLSRRLKELQYEIDIATAKWEQATETLGQIESQAAAPNDERGNE